MPFSSKAFWIVVFRSGFGLDTMGTISLAEQSSGDFLMSHVTLIGLRVKQEDLIDEHS